MKAAKHLWLFEHWPGTWTFSNGKQAGVLKPVTSGHLAKSEEGKCIVLFQTGCLVASGAHTLITHHNISQNSESTQL